VPKDIASEVASQGSCEYQPLKFWFEGIEIGPGGRTNHYASASMNFEKYVIVSISIGRAL